MAMTTHKRFHKEAGEEPITMGWAHGKNGRETVNEESGCAQIIGQEKGKRFGRIGKGEREIRGV